jgi:hypothetical protein
LGDDGETNTFPCEPVWSAKAKITSSATSTAFPPLSVLYAQAYLDYQVADATLGLAYYTPSQVPPFSGSPSITREDILYPCKTNDYSFCQGICTAVYSKNYLPRLFHEGNYTVNVYNGQLQPDIPVTCPVLDSSIDVTGLTCFRKTLPSNSDSSSIQYIWAKQLGSRWEVAIGLAADGTLWELFLQDAVTRGVYLADPVAPVTVPPSWEDPVQLPFTATTVDLAGTVPCCVITSSGLIS